MLDFVTPCWITASAILDYENGRFAKMDEYIYE